MKSLIFLGLLAVAFANPGILHREICASDEFLCKSGRVECIPASWACDCEWDCEDGSDEIYCPETCLSTRAPNRDRDPMINEDLFEGDIIGIDPDSDRNAVADDNRLWPNGRVPYVISPELDDLKDDIRRAMDHIEHHSCVRFVEKTPEDKDYVKIFKDNGCYSHWGRTGGEQQLSLGNGCSPFGTIVHELLHAIGFEHEHNRSDRDEYLTINWENIQENFKYAFKKLRPDQNRLLTQFDFSSIMLYGSRSFAKEYDKYSMVRTDGLVLEEVYNKKAISVLDKERINTLYKCPQTTTAGMVG